MQGGTKNKHFNMSKNNYIKITSMGKKTKDGEEKKERSVGKK